jgi:hypothetical protein
MAALQVGAEKTLDHPHDPDYGRPDAIAGQPRRRSVPASNGRYPTMVCWIGALISWPERLWLGHRKVVVSMRSTATGSDQLIDQFLPDWDFREDHSRRIDAPASQVRAALLAITPRELPLSGVILAIRLAPAAFVARRWPWGLDRSWIELLFELGFIELANRDEEIVFGAVGKFWRLREETVPLAGAEAFARFQEPGFAKGAMNFRIAEQSGTTRLTTETRVQATDNGALRSFRPYWIPVRAIGGLMRLEMLRAVARRVKRSPENVSG